MATASMTLGSGCGDPTLGCLTAPCGPGPQRTFTTDHSAVPTYDVLFVVDDTAAIAGSASVLAAGFPDMARVFEGLPGGLPSDPRRLHPRHVAGERLHPSKRTQRDVWRRVSGRLPDHPRLRHEPELLGHPAGRVRVHGRFRRAGLREATAARGGAARARRGSERGWAHGTNQLPARRRRARHRAHHQPGRRVGARGRSGSRGRVRRLLQGPEARPGEPDLRIGHDTGDRRLFFSDADPAPHIAARRGFRSQRQHLHFCATASRFP